jgi:predicted GTPase
MLFREEDDVVFPERVGVVEGKNLFVLETDRDTLKAGQDLAAIEITDRHI